jgi:FkbM family methyltransferase
VAIHQKKIMKYLKRLYFLWKVCNFKEFVTITYHHFLTKKLVEKDIQLQRVLIFVISCVDKHYTLTLLDKDLIQVEGIGSNPSLKFIVRKYTRDILVFDGYFISNDYMPFVEYLQRQVSFIQFIVDVGANIGCSALFFHQYFPEATIICIEPEESNIKILKKNILINKAENKIKTIKKALWNTTTTLELRRIDFSNDGFHVMQEGTTHGIIDKVATCTLPEILKENAQIGIDLLKIDIEGAEKIIFEDETHLQSFLPNTQSVIMEVHPEYISDEKIMSVLRKFDFEAKTVVIEGQPTAVIAHKNKAL